MKDIRLNKEYNLNINNCFDIKYGSVNRLNPSVIYITCKSWILPNKEMNYRKHIDDILNSFKQNLKRTIIQCDLFDNKFIYDDSINYTTMKVNKKNYFSFEFYIRRNECTDELSNLNEIMYNTFKNVINDLSNELSNDFILTKSKK